MIQGSVVGRQPRIKLVFTSETKPDLEIGFVVDTGFEGTLTLPAEAIALLGLPYLTTVKANLADDSNVNIKLYLAEIMWRGSKREVVVLAMGRRPLVGTTLLEGYHLGIDFYQGGSVIVDKIL
jgi:clan AA aspartic protease